MEMNNFDFGGWATKNDIKCTDGRIIRHNAFKDQDGLKVPVVWNHEHNDLEHVLGHAILENRDEGVYAYVKLNNSPNGELAREHVKHGDVTSLSIYANKLKQNGSDVVHGIIREVSLVLAGANPGAVIDNVMAHSEDGDEGAYIYSGEDFVVYDELSHANSDDSKENDKTKEESKVAESNDKTIQDVIDSMSEEQKNVMNYLVGMALEEGKRNSKGGDEEMAKHNVFEGDTTANDEVLMHTAMEAIIRDGKKHGSLKESYLEHAEEYGIDQIDVLFPDAKNLNTTPEFIKRETGWVQKVMNKVHHTPMSRVKSTFADITEDEARAKGYIKGKLKKEEVFSLLKRTTTPTTIYKKQKMDRDDVIDITDFDVLSWLKAEMRMMLDEEIARAILIGDGRLASDDDHINDSNIRPILNDASLFTIRWSVGNGTSDEDRAKNFIKAAIKSRKNYRGSGNPDLYTTEDMLTDMLLIEDKMGHKLYKTEQELATALRVKEIITVPVMENAKDKDNKDVLGIIINLDDYNVGADKGGAVNMFDDFDIDYNQMKYLIETRCSGALVKPFSAIVLRSGSATQSDEPTLAAAKEEIA